MIKDNVTTGSIAIADKPLGASAKKKYRKFNVSDETFMKFKTGKTRFETWSKYLNLQDEKDKEVYDYHQKNHDSIIILRNEITGALRAIRKRGPDE
jgi:hypothetical protein